MIYSGALLYKINTMKIIITGSLGNISQPLAKELMAGGHLVTVISSDAAKKETIEKLGAIAAIGTLEDADFLSDTFAGADAVYTMVPPGNYFDPALDLLAYYHRLGNNYAQAIRQSGVKRVVNLSTIGAHLEKGSGILIGAHDVAEILNDLPQDVSITQMRPTSFYYNLLPYIGMIKHTESIAANYGGAGIIPWVSPKDIAIAIAEELQLAEPAARTVRYVASEELTGKETAAILGSAIGKPDLEWKLISSEETLEGLKAIGMNPKIAAGLVEMYASLENELLSEDYFRNRPAVMGKVKLVDFAKDFAEAFDKG
jgi:uncharacterized protein YbjT (DUF2867 family)